MGVEPMNNGFADRRVSHFATSPRPPRLAADAGAAAYRAKAESQ